MTRYRQTALSRTKNQLMAAEEFIKHQTKVHEDEIIRFQKDNIQPLREEIETVNNTLRSTKEIYHTKCAELRDCQSKLVAANELVEKLRYEVNSSRNFLAESAIKVARIEGYLTRVNEHPATPPVDETRLVEIPRWLAVEALNRHKQEKELPGAWERVMSMSSGVASPQYSPEKKWFSL